MSIIQKMPYCPEKIILHKVEQRLIAEAVPLVMGSHPPQPSSALACLNIQSKSLHRSAKMIHLAMVVASLHLHAKDFHGKKLTICAATGTR